MLPFILGSMVGSVSWIIVLIYFLRPGSASDISAPGFVISLFLFINTFAINFDLSHSRRDEHRRQAGFWSQQLRPTPCLDSLKKLE